MRFENPPVVEISEPVCLPSGETFAGRLKYFDYGVVSLELELQFESDWEELIRLSSRWIEAPDLERSAIRVVRKRMADLGGTCEWESSPDQGTKVTFRMRLNQPV